MSKRPAVVAALLTAAAASLAPTASATYPGQNGPVAYSTYAYSKKAEFNVKGTYVNTIVPGAPATDRRVLTGDAFGFFVSVSPDGQRLALGTVSGLFVSDVSGQGLKRIVNAADVATATWSHDGATIVYARFGSGLWSVPATGGAASALLPNPSDFTLVHEPAFTADGSALLYSRLTTNRKGVITGSEIWRAAPDGSDPARVVSGTGQRAVLQQASASPDGTRLAFVAETTGDVPKSRVYVSNLDGSGPRPVSPLAGKGRAYNTAVWSPDGTRLVVSHVALDMAKGSSLELIDPASSQVTVLKKIKRGMLVGPSWGPAATG